MGATRHRILPISTDRCFWTSALEPTSRQSREETYGRRDQGDQEREQRRFGLRGHQDDDSGEEPEANHVRRAEPSLDWDDLRKA